MQRARQDHIQEDHKKQIHRAVMWHTLRNDLAQQPPFCLVWSSICVCEQYFGVNNQRHGAVIESIYVLIFIIYATKEKAKIFEQLMFVLSVFAAVALVSLLALHGNTRKIFCGFDAAISLLSCMPHHSL
ncbi:hypothetical protein Dsin_003875 [Dipteronia sinensis]|uniref:Uncharacterized protein n=1 Tax=Dipteronia sinensis TaxID=43782 RepID=A0AAE0BAB5_9ROSI|nr:hypothetical protein Dsin_003875 [Dipteronia sinensis]